MSRIDKDIERDEIERGSAHRPALDRLVGAAAADFDETYWARRPLLTRAADLPTPFTDLLSVEAVDELVAERGLRTPFARMAHDGVVLDRNSFTASGGFGAEMPDQLDSAAVLDAFATGATLVLQGLHRVWPPLIDFVRGVVDDVGHPTQVNAYVTPASSRGFDPHYDVHDVFVLQVSGRKRWIVHPPVHANPLSNQPWSDHRSAVGEMAATEPTIDTVLDVGDSLYIPRGWIHSATALGDATIHLTVGVAAMTRYDVVHKMLSAFRDDERFRAPLPLGIDTTDAGAVVPHVRAVLEDMTALLDSLDDTAVHDVAEQVGRRFVELTRPDPVRPMRTVAAMTTLSADDTVVWRRGLDARLSENDASVSILLRDKTVTLPQQCGPALSHLHSGKPTRVGDLPGLDADDSLVVVRRLLREAIVVPAP